MNAASVASFLLVGMSLLGVTADACAESQWRLGVAVGHGVRTNPLIQSDDIPVAVDLDIAWFGERFYFDNFDAGFTVIDSDAVTVNAVGRINSDRVFFGKTDTRLVQIGAAIGQATVSAPGALLAQPTELAVPDRDYAVELGIEVLADGRWGRLQLAAHHDASGTHDGYEIFLDYGYGWRRQRWSIEPSVGFAYKSDELNDYYWGVRPEEAGAALPAYRAGSGVNPHVKLAASYQMTRHWSVAIAAEYERLATEAAASPIVADRDVVGYFAGAHYRF
ncbi:MAG TPA: MipA/OmpV family protein [Gammaproteobacteria bacterium]|nr:MipA/OmpV family protein [Gammaproteobacteria bacterium]